MVVIVPSVDHRSYRQSSRAAHVRVHTPGAPAIVTLNLRMYRMRAVTTDSVSWWRAADSAEVASTIALPVTAAGGHQGRWGLDAWRWWHTHGSPSFLQNVPPDLSICTFVLEQSLSVRALQEMLANTVEKSEGASTLKTEYFSVLGCCGMVALTGIGNLVCGDKSEAFTRDSLGVDLLLYLAPLSYLKDLKKEI